MTPKRRNPSPAPKKPRPAYWTMRLDLPRNYGGTTIPGVLSVRLDVPWRLVGRDLEIRARVIR